MLFSHLCTQKDIALMKSPFHYFSVGAIFEFCQNLWKSLISEGRIDDAIFTSLDGTSPRKLRKTVKTTHYTLSAKRNLSLRRSDTQENPKHQNESYLDTDELLQYSLPGAAPGCLLRGGGGAKSLATAAPALKYCSSAEKVAQQGGGGGGGEGRGSDTKTRKS